MSAWKWERVDGKLVRPWGFRAVFTVFALMLVGTEVYTAVRLLCDSDPRNCKECAEMCSPLPVLECAVQPDKSVWCRCDGRGQRGYEPPKED